MRYIMVYPSFGYDVIDQQKLRLQPWNYLIQVAEALIEGGEEMVIAPDVPLSRKVRKLFENVGAVVKELNQQTLGLGDVIISPIALGVLLRITKMLKNSKPIIGVLTTPLIGLGEGITNYLRVLTSKTQVASSAIIKENIGFRLRRSFVCRAVQAFITPSKDLAIALYKVLRCRVKVALFYPRVALPRIEGTETEVITYFGPFTEERGVVSLLKAFEKVSNELPNYKLRLLIRDKGSSRLNLLERLLMRIKEKVIVHVGSIPRRELMSIVSNSALITLPYRFVASTVPLAYLEALQLQGPVVFSTGVPGVEEHVRTYMGDPLRSTYLAKDLANLIISLLSNENLKRTIRKAQVIHASRLIRESASQARELPRWMGDRVGSA